MLLAQFPRYQLVEASVHKISKRFNNETDSSENTSHREFNIILIELLIVNKPQPSYDMH